MRSLTLIIYAARRLWPAVLAALLLAAHAILIGHASRTAPRAAAQEESRRILTIVAPALNVRRGPGVTYPAFDMLLQGAQVRVVGYDAASAWWQVQLPGGATGWVSGGAAYVSVSSEASESGPGPVDQNMPAAGPDSQNGALGSTLVFQTAGGGPIYAIDPDTLTGGGNLRYLTTGFDPALSPDGQWVAFTRWETSQDGALGSVWLIHIDGSQEQALHTNVFNPRTPTWSADGTKLVIRMQYGGQIGELDKCSSRRPPRKAYDISVSRDAEGELKFCFTLPPDPHWRLRRIDVTGGAHEDLPGDTYSLTPAWDPNDSEHIVYDGDFGLVNLDLGEGRTWDLTEDFNDHGPVFSPDGSQIAVTYRQDDHWEVHVLNADGSGRRRLTQTSYQTLVEQQLAGETPHSFINAAPAWSPDGSQLAFVTNRTGQFEIWVMNADGSNQRPMFPPEILAGIPLQYSGVEERMLSWR